MVVDGEAAEVLEAGAGADEDEVGFGGSVLAACQRRTLP